MKRKHLHPRLASGHLARKLFIERQAADRPAFRSKLFEACVASTLAFRKVIVSVNGAIKIAAIKIAPEGTWSGSPLPQFWRKLKMKNRTIFAVLLAVILAVPVFAQDNSAPMNQPATSQASSSQASSSKTATATGKDPLQPETREGFWGHMNPFARKKYVARQTQPIRDRVNELDELTA